MEIYRFKKNREEERLNYENLNNLISYISGDMNYSKNGNDVKQTSKYIASLYQLSLLKKQSFIILPFLNYIKKFPDKTHNDNYPIINQAIDYVLEKLK